MARSIYPKKEEITFEIVNELVRCDFETGKLFWNVRGVEWFQDGYRTAQGNCNNWNALYENHQAFDTPHVAGYLCGRLFRVPFLTHRIVWLLYNKKWPSNEIDHFDGIRTNNAISNLREVTRAENNKNRVQQTGDSGFLGVIQNPSGTWAARIVENYKFTCLGSYETKEEAAEVARMARLEQGFTERHANAQL